MYWEGSKISKAFNEDLNKLKTCAIWTGPLLLN